MPFLSAAIYLGHCLPWVIKLKRYGSGSHPQFDLPTPLWHYCPKQGQLPKRPVSDSQISKGTFHASITYAKRCKEKEGSVATVARCTGSYPISEAQHSCAWLILEKVRYRGALSVGLPSLMTGTRENRALGNIQSVLNSYNIYDTDGGHSICGG